MPTQFRYDQDTDRPSQTKPSILGGGLLGEEQFDVALILDQARDVQQGLIPSKLHECDLELFKRSHPSFEIKECLVGVEAISHFLLFALNDAKVKLKKSSKESWGAAQTASFYQAKHYVQSTRGQLRETLLQVVDSIPNITNPLLTPSLRRLSSLIPLFLKRISAADYSFQCRMEEGKYISANPEGSPTLTLQGELGDIQLTFGRKLVLMDCREGRFLLTYDQWVMFHNKLVELWLILSYSFLSEGVQFTAGFHRRILSFVNSQLRLIRRYGNRAYDFSVNLEGFLTGLVISRTESWENLELKNTMWDAIHHLKLGFPVSYEESYLSRIFDECSVPELIEMCGLIKITGHPDIQTEKGLQKLYDRTHKYIPITYDSIEEVINTIKQDFCKHYLRKHRKWPTVYLTPATPPLLLNAILRNRWIDDVELVRQHGALADLSVWNEVTLGQISEFDWVESHMPFLKDRALAPKYSQLAKDEAERIQVPLSDRRVLLKFLLTRNVFTLTDRYLEHYGEDPESVVDYLVIKLTQKEKELKIGGRMFGQSPYEERFRRCVMEHNVSRLMIDYDPYQSMTTSELQKINKLLTFRSLRRDVKGGRVIQFSVDAEAWNNYFRPELVNAVGQAFFDKIFNVTLYSHCMDTYVLSYIFAQVKQKRIGWHGQPGGIEGLSQKVWTWIYSRVVLRVLESLGYKGYIMVCGDDLRVAVIFPEDEFTERTAAQVAAGFKDRLQAAFDRYGFKMKLSETVASEIFIAYGKVYQVGESFMSSCLKKVAKIHGFQGTTFPLIEQQVASIYSNAHAACQVTTSHLVLHLLAGLVTTIRLQGKVQSPLTRLEMIEILCRPSVLGGLPILHLCHFMVRGESDHLSIAVSFALYLISSNIDPGLGWSLICTPITKGRVDFVQLLTDPYCLPLEKPESASAYLKKVMDRHIRIILKNLKIKQVLRLYNKRKERQFVAALKSATPYLAKVLSVLWECSPFNILSEVIQKFESSRSIFQLLCVNRRRKGVYRILENARIRESKTIAHMRSLATRSPFQLTDFEQKTLTQFTGQSHIHHPHLADCPTSYTQRWRDKAWGYPVLTVTYPCMSDFLVIWSASDLYPESFQEDHILSKLTIDPNINSNLHFSDGNRTPWIGTKTSEKLFLPQAGLDFEGSISVKISKILKLIEFVRFAGQDMIDIIEWVLYTISGKSLADFCALIPSKTGGTIAHRLRSRAFHETIMLNELPNRSQLIAVFHDAHSLLQSRTGDYSVNYMALICHHLTTILFPLEMTRYIPVDSYGNMFYSQVVVDCPDCFYDVSMTATVQIDAPLPSVAPFPEDNPLIGFTKALDDELTRKCLRVGLTGKFDVNLRESLAHDVSDESANNIVSSALIKESFGGALEAYSLGIQVNYESQRFKMESLHNLPMKAKMSLRDWKAVTGLSIVSALIQETYNWLLTDKKLRSRNESDVSNLPPQLNPFTMISERLVSTERVREVYQGFVTLGYSVRPLGAFDLTTGESCARWLLACCYPIAVRILRSRVLSTQLLTFYTYESDDTIIDRLNRNLNHSCISFYQSILRCLYGTYILDIPIEKSLDSNQTSSYFILNTIRTGLRQNTIDIHWFDHQLHCIFKYLTCFIDQVGVPSTTTEIPFGTSEYFCTGNTDIDDIADFLVGGWQEFLDWPVPAQITRDLDLYPELDVNIIDEIYDTLIWPAFQVERYGLFPCVSRVREILSQKEEDDPMMLHRPRIPIAHQLIHIGEHRSVLRDIRDLTSNALHAGCRPIIEDVLGEVEVYQQHEEIRIPMSTLTRTHGLTITSVVKLHEIFIRLGLHAHIERARSEFWAACLADGEGGFTNYLLGLSPFLNVIFNSLYVPSPNTPMVQSYPGEVMLSNDVGKIPRCHSRHNYSGANDLTSLQTIRELERIVKQKTHGEGLSLITMDAEGKLIDENEDYLILIRNILSFGIRTLARRGTMILKTFPSRRRELWGMLHLFTDCFLFSRWIKPDSSHSNNGEFYLIVANPLHSKDIRNKIAEKLTSGDVFGPGNATFRTDVVELLTTIRRRRNEIHLETPGKFLTWSICNHRDNRLPGFTWGVLHRRLSLNIPPGFVEPITDVIEWNENTLQSIEAVCRRSLHEAQTTIESGQSTALPYTTHAHRCFRLSIWCRQLGFFLCINRISTRITLLSHYQMAQILQEGYDEGDHLAQHCAIRGLVIGGIINDNTPNLRVNIHAEIRSGFSLGLRTLTVRECSVYYQAHDQPPLYPHWNPDED